MWFSPFWLYLSTNSLDQRRLVAVGQQREDCLNKSRYSKKIVQCTFKQTLMGILPQNYCLSRNLSRPFFMSVYVTMFRFCWTEISLAHVDTLRCNCSTYATYSDDRNFCHSSLIGISPDFFKTRIEELVIQVVIQLYDYITRYTRIVEIRSK